MKLVVKRDKVGFYTRALVKLFEGYNKILPNTRVSYIPFSNINAILCRNFSMKKQEVMEYLRIFEEFGYISFVKFKGIKLEYTVE